MSIKNKNIIVGITGGIAAYKAAILIRGLVKQGAQVKVIMTPMAKEFITPLTLATLSKNPILVDFYNPENGDWNSHVDLGLWADLYIIAPASANTMAKMAHGIADNLLLTTYLSAKCPVFVCPAMDLDMYKHQATQNNLDILRGYGVKAIEPASGELASGLIGKGRMEEPEIIVEHIQQFFTQSKRFVGKKVLITAGPTHEKIDAVRFIGNHSSGKMGYAIAGEFAAQGAEVTIISGPVSLSTQSPDIKIQSVTTAAQMHDAAINAFPGCDIAIMAAAVADYTPENPSEQKIKRKGNDVTIKLKPTKDIAAEIGKRKTEKQITVGFALETHNEMANAEKKLHSKNLDFIVLNSLQNKGAGFGHDTNKISIIQSNNKTVNYELKSKKEVAKDIVEKIAAISLSKGIIK